MSIIVSYRSSRGEKREEDKTRRGSAEQTACHGRALLQGTATHLRAGHRVGIPLPRRCRASRYPSAPPSWWIPAHILPAEFTRRLLFSRGALTEVEIRTQSGWSRVMSAKGAAVVLLLLSKRGRQVRDATPISTQA